MPQLHMALCAGMAAAVLSLGVSPADAKISCNDGYQRVQGNEINTPYCQDALLRRVARQYGMKVSDSGIRNNPNLKSEVCRFVGHDNRVKSHCAGSGDDGRGRGR